MSVEEAPEDENQRVTGNDDARDRLA